MKILYGKTLDGICIQRCFGWDGTVQLPDSIEGLPVTSLAPYVFSGSMKRALAARGGFQGELGLWDSQEKAVRRGLDLAGQDPDQWEDLPALQGGQVRSLTLPAGLKQVGAYGFYGCEELEFFSFSSSVSDWGAGVFTGCGRLKRLAVRIVPDRRSCLREVLTELRQTLILDYLNQEGGLLARLVLPEFYEDSVENTPARIIMREMHGCGHMYRYCFDQNTGFSFPEYDSLFPYMKAQDNPGLAGALALYRLYWPWKLGEEEAKGYWDYLNQWPVQALEAALREDMKLVSWLAQSSQITRESLEAMIQFLGGREEPQALAALMDGRNRRFAVSHERKRKFQL